jgi:hypothetical protein
MIVDTIGTSAYHEQNTIMNMKMQWEIFKVGIFWHTWGKRWEYDLRDEFFHIGLIITKLTTHNYIWHGENSTIIQEVHKKHLSLNESLCQYGPTTSLLPIQLEP